MTLDILYLFLLTQIPYITHTTYTAVHDFMSKKTLKRELSSHLLILEVDYKEMRQTFSLCHFGLAEIGDIVDSVREGIKYIVAFEGRLRKFSDFAKRLKLPGKKLILDVPTRWNNTYIMLATAIQFKEVFSTYHQSDQAFQWLVSPGEWEKVENVNQLLSIFNEVTSIVFGSEYPTSNLFLPKVWWMKEILLLKCRDNNDYIRAMTSKMSNKFEKYWGNCNSLMALAAMLDPRYFPLIYPELKASMNIDNVLSILHELYEENSHSTSGSTRVAAVKKSTGQSIFMEYIRSNDVVRPTKTDLDVYLEDGVYICEKDVDGEDRDAEFEALAWWKFNTLKYRIFFKMARDILPVSITTVASESSFSTGGRVIDPHRARLSTETIEIILCGSD
ncbi:zinc finger BED domain-containing protein RICESLEEPER 2-like [Alnus glutinosa]|uniref:zinc finger BED domain-containing protein RICESLEEPER 2-like n=1 Tax=Alnus glutinosa TaxID=3517 RepID=UPI002D79A56C|nr:zinc finger BED domain-containing protein RICESLEEPER 2-like [Alnus glutinosa]